MNAQKFIISCTSLVVVVLFSTLLFISCAKHDPVFNGTKIDACANNNVACYNGGTCLDGVCHCPAGFEGIFCDSLWNNRYTGTYDANDQCSIGNNYIVTIAPNTSQANQIVINNISKFCTNVSLAATINPDKTTISIAPQRYCDSLYISGVGTQADSKSFINLWLTSRDSVSHTSINCSIILHKQ